VVVGPATLPADAQIVTIRVSVHLRPSWYCASHCWVPGTPGIALTNKEASYSQVTGGVVGPDKLSARNWLAFWRSVSWIIRRIKLRTKPLYSPQGYAPKLSESASESSGVPLVARLRRWLLMRGLNDFDRQAILRVDTTKPRQWLMNPNRADRDRTAAQVDITKPCRWLMKRAVGATVDLDCAVANTKPLQWLLKLPSPLTAQPS